MTSNHAVVIVGMDRDNWIVQNSWGVFWGERGYIKIKKVQEDYLINSHICVCGGLTCAHGSFIFPNY